ncbi:hypothetical protein O181_029356 [Austropuccinia psidii MF-1]|uniref:Integrase catalytic domain-containing protein n=1 Tax=Austropuccinia psidii MF-1 TaxID=1389203 RepID=A0A9Q3H382_9BASI|nr:hypothetical protein [Austropuccinia psidii MF-1]
MIGRFCSYGLEFKDSDDFTHDWCTLIPALEVAYRKSIHYSTGRTPATLEKGWNPTLPYYTLRKGLVGIYSAEKSLKIMLDKARHHANRFMHNSFKYANERWDCSHKPPEIKVGDFVLVSNLDFSNIKEPMKLKEGPFIIRELHGPNSVQLELTGELMNNHPNFS